MTNALRSRPATDTSRGSLVLQNRPIKVLIVDTAIAFGGSLVVARNLLKHLDATLVQASLVSACSDGFVSDIFAGSSKVTLLSPRIDYVTLGNWKLKLNQNIAWRPLRRALRSRRGETWPCR